jgi:hypothetical protein
MKERRCINLNLNNKKFREKAFIKKKLEKRKRKKQKSDIVGSDNLSGPGD